MGQRLAGATRYWLDVWPDFIDPQLILTQVRSVKCDRDSTVAIQWDGPIYEWGRLPGHLELTLVPTRYGGKP